MKFWRLIVIMRLFNKNKIGIVVCPVALLFLRIFLAKKNAKKMNLIWSIQIGSNGPLFTNWNLSMETTHSRHTHTHVWNTRKTKGKQITRRQQQPIFQNKITINKVGKKWIWNVTKHVGVIFFCLPFQSLCVFVDVFEKLGFHLLIRRASRMPQICRFSDFSSHSS